MAAKEVRERDIAKLLKQSDEVNHPVGETLPMEQHVYRVRVLKSFLRAAVSLSKLNSFRDLLEENRYDLSDHRHMSDLVPLVVSQEQEEIKQEILGRAVSVVFDGTTRLGEIMAIVVRFVDGSFTIRQRLIRLQLLAKSMSGKEIAKEIINSLLVMYSISSNLVIAMMHDRAACNGVALCNLKVVFPTIVDIGCSSHTQDLVGEKFVTPTLSSFATWWISLFSHSPKEKLLWHEHTGQSFQGYSATR